MKTFKVLLNMSEYYINISLTVPVTYRKLVPFTISHARKIPVNGLYSYFLSNTFCQRQHNKLSWTGSRGSVIYMFCECFWYSASNNKRNSVYFKWYTLQSSDCTYVFWILFCKTRDTVVISITLFVSLIPEIGYKNPVCIHHKFAIGR